MDVDALTMEDRAAELFELYIAHFASWEDPTRGAVGASLARFFERCDPQAPAVVHWARWLRMAHEDDEGTWTIAPAAAEALVEALIRACIRDAALANAMRRAVRGEPIGEWDPNQLSLFS